jgi:hypothetical protein
VMQPCAFSAFSTAMSIVRCALVRFFLRVIFG